MHNLLTIYAQFTYMTNVILKDVRRSTKELNLNYVLPRLSKKFLYYYFRKLKKLFLFVILFIVKTMYSLSWQPFSTFMSLLCNPSSILAV